MILLFKELNTTAMLRISSGLCLLYPTADTACYQSKPRAGPGMPDQSDVDPRP